jgi:hypothetical protein
MVSTGIRPVFNSFSSFLTYFRYSLFFPSNAPFAPPTILQTESKGNFCLMTLYSHKNFLTPKIFPKNSHFFQTFSNSAGRHFAPLNSLSQRSVRGGVLSLRAAEKRVGVRAVTSRRRKRLRVRAARYFGTKDSFIHKDTTTPCPKLSSVRSL